MADEYRETAAARLCRMEELFDALTERYRLAPEKLRCCTETKEMVRTLAEYLAGGLWLADYEADERGEFPKELKRGILSQDALYNLLCDVEREMMGGKE
jgi:hypothetical protein